jgi:hypothetical protein
MRDVLWGFIAILAAVVLAAGVILGFVGYREGLEVERDAQRLEAFAECWEDTRVSTIQPDGSVKEEPATYLYEVCVEDKGYEAQIESE